ncbi:MAG: hypothetical protein LUE98_01675 [Tannerellaceae bacterium]|nr:hypothetical protein [Tannerellaceae bacterium]
MEKKYEQPKKNNDTLREPAMKYEIQEEIKILPLTEEDLKDYMTREEFVESVCAHIDKLFDK